MCDGVASEAGHTLIVSGKSGFIIKQIVFNTAGLKSIGDIIVTNRGEKKLNC